MTGKKRLDPTDSVDTDTPEGTSAPAERAGAPPAPVEDDPQTAELARLKAREDELLRALAEQQNVVRRRRQEMDASLRYAQEDWVRELLPVLDDFERAMLAMGSERSDPLRAGVTLVHERLLRLLDRRGLAAIRPLGEAFDPALHDAIAQRPDPEAAPGTVLEVVEPGYRLQERVLRHAKVIVAGPPASDHAAGAGEKGA